MTPSARVQAAIELLDEIIDAAKTKGAPADRLIANYFKQRRYAGSKDRRAVRELVYSAIRACGPVPRNGRAAMLRLAEIDPSILLLFDGSNHGPEPVRDNEMAAAGGIAPEWLTDALAASGVSTEAMEALLDRASLDVRVNTLKTDRGRIDLPQAGEILTAPHALRFPTGTLVEQWPQYRDGQIEVQDHGSQLICEAIHVAQGDPARLFESMVSERGGVSSRIAPIHLHGPRAHSPTPALPRCRNCRRVALIAVALAIDGKLHPTAEPAVEDSSLISDQLLS